MATATETKNGVQAAADQTSRAALQAFEALSDYYLAAFDAGLKMQARAIETGKMLLDESANFQRANRKLAEELVQGARKAQQEVFEATETGMRAGQAVWPSVDRR